MKNISLKKRQSAFSLIELIIVIIIIGILAVSLSNITRNAVYSYIDGKDRNRQSQSGKWVAERISREIREALPQSVRTGDSGGIHCVEFMNIINASSYINLPASGNITTINAAGFDLSTTAATLIAIMPLNATTLYGATGTLGNVASIAAAGSQVVITLTAPTNFNRRSPLDRFYLLSSPVSFCLNNNNGQITRHTGYSLAGGQQFPPTAGSSQLFEENFSANGNVFNYQPGTLSRAGLLQMNFRLQNRNRGLTGGEEAFEIFHEVHIRNVP